MDTIPEPEVPERPTGGGFSAAYKVAILDAYEAATELGAKGALLRREGLNSSHLTEWRRFRCAPVDRADGLLPDRDNIGASACRSTTGSPSPAMRRLKAPD